MSEDNEVPMDQQAEESIEATTEEPSEPSPDSEQAPGVPQIASDEAGTDGEPKRRRAWWIPIILILVIAAAAVGGYYFYQQAQRHSAAAAKVDDATRLIEDADMVVLDVDEAVRAEITAEVGEQAAEIQGRVPPAIDDLEQAVALIDEALPDLADDDVAHAEALRASAQARADMLGMVDPILEGNVKAGAALQPSLDAWGAVLEGETISDEAIGEYNKLTNDGVKKSQTLTADALEQFEKAKDLFATAASAFPEADFSLYTAYVDGKIALLGISKQANEAFLSGDKAKANDLSNQYNAKDKELVEQAGKLPATPAEVIAAAYEELAGDATTAYFDARDRATEADARLNALEG